MHERGISGIYNQGFGTWGLRGEVGYNTGTLGLNMIDVTVDHDLALVTAEAGYELGRAFFIEPWDGRKYRSVMQIRTAKCSESEHWTAGHWSFLAVITMAGWFPRRHNALVLGNMKVGARRARKVSGLVGQSGQTVFASGGLSLTATANGNQSIPPQLFLYCGKYAPNAQEWPMPRKAITHSLTIALIATGLAVVPALAGGGPKMKHGNNGYGVGQVAFCPPGLAKKYPPCVPPGLAKSYLPREYRRDDDYWRGYYDGQHWLGDGDDYGWTRPDGTVIRIGDPLTGLPYHLIFNPDLYGLPHVGDTWRYAIADNRIVRIDQDTLQVLSLIRMVEAILD